MNVETEPTRSLFLSLQSNVKLMSYREGRVAAWWNTRGTGNERGEQRETTEKENEKTSAGQRIEE
jgi:hypothetical protein